MTRRRSRLTPGAIALLALTACSAEATLTGQIEASGGSGARAGQGSGGAAGQGVAGLSGAGGGGASGASSGAAGTASGAAGVAGSTGGGGAGAAGSSGASGQSGFPGAGGSAGAGAGGGESSGGAAGLSGSSGQGGDPGAGGSAGGGSGGKDPCAVPLCLPGSGGSGTVVGEDQDLDGFAFPEDCNDCDPQINPGAFDHLDSDLFGELLPPDQQVDDDCSGTASLVDELLCDAGLALDDPDPLMAMRALGLCQTTTASARTWGVLSAEYVQLDGSPLPAGGPLDPALGHGLLASFGPNVSPERGARVLALSTGVARVPGQPGFVDLAGGDRAYGTSLPAGFPLVSSTCQVAGGALRDSIALRLRLRAPTNAKYLSFKSKFHTHAFPDQVCSAFDDAFVVVMRDKDGQFIPGSEPATGNIVLDKDAHSLTVNGARLDVCDPAMAVGNSLCEMGTDELAGTGFEGHGATTWLQTSAPVVPGEEFELLFGVTDAGDGLRTSTVLLDDFRWSFYTGEVTGGTPVLCEGGGAGECASCAACLEKNAVLCCGSQTQACQEDPDCAAIVACVQGCGEDKLCRQACVDEQPGGQPRYTALDTCIHGPAGDPQNHGACGLVCAP